MRISDWSSALCSSDLPSSAAATLRTPPSTRTASPKLPAPAVVPPVNVPLHQLTSADFQRSLDINVLGVFHCMKHQIAAMLKAGSGGSIVNTARREEGRVGK